MLRLPESAGGSSPPGSKYEGFVIDLIQVEPSDSSYLSSFEMEKLILVNMTYTLDRTKDALMLEEIESYLYL